MEHSGTQKNKRSLGELDCGWYLHDNNQLMKKQNLGSCGKDQNHQTPGSSSRHLSEARKKNVDHQDNVSTEIIVNGFNVLDALCYDKILEYLDIRSLYRLAFCSKILMDVVSHKHVVRSAVVSGGSAAKRTITELVSLIQQKSIVIPSPLRLLRLTNGKYCEFGPEKCCMLVSNEEKNRLFFSRGHGLFCCKECHKKITKKSKYVSLGTFDKDVMIEPHYDAAGERCGSLLSFSECERWHKQKDITVVTKSLPASSYFRSLVETRKAFNLHLQSFHEDVSHNPWVHQQGSILRCFDKANRDIKQLEFLWKERERKKKADALSKRIGQTKALVQKVDNFLRSRSTSCQNKYDGSPDHSNDWIESLLSCTYKDPTNEQDLCRSTKRNAPCASFACTLVDSKLKPFAISPSKGSAKEMKRIADELRDQLNLIWSKKFNDFDFLAQEGNNQLEGSSLRLHFKELYPSMQALLHSPGMDEKCIQMLRQDKLFDALERIEVVERGNSYVTDVLSLFSLSSRNNDGSSCKWLELFN